MYMMDENRKGSVTMEKAKARNKSETKSTEIKAVNQISGALSPCLQDDTKSIRSHTSVFDILSQDATRRSRIRSQSHSMLESK